ncbi:isocitrate lyase/phosphoenolpyruvate mutase family protein [Leuconostoc citreum]|uniref:isocitrate lyase/phosphoenolpyruvate mutase family protein n=1 Tax=Leuconostoc citreum TaxID=33964 RepID=UPI00200A750F|nr:isocitrate lyase/phosphoenolpyruvate mutase family protein [Leuconostoc citreum]MCK8606221.1 isocitrate lyase/phosphoenolpyruvate mutase family protein [Leuconostoc citreum]
MNKSEFLELHERDRPLTLLNVWSKESAKSLENSGVKIVASSSFGAASSTNQDDGQHISIEEATAVFDELSPYTFRSLDFEAGYSDDAYGLQRNIEYLFNKKINGINLEDKLPGENNIQGIKEFTEKINILHATDTQNKLFINVRTDSFFQGDIILQNKNTDLLRDTIERINHYEKYAIDSIFIPGLKNKEFIRTISRNVSVPLNIMLDIEKDSIEDYLSLGISRISFGPSTYIEKSKTNIAVDRYFKQKINQLSYLDNNELINLARR